MRLLSFSSCLLMSFFLVKRSGIYFHLQASIRASGDGGTFVPVFRGVLLAFV